MQRRLYVVNVTLRMLKEDVFSGNNIMTNASLQKNIYILCDYYFTRCLKSDRMKMDKPEYRYLKHVI